MNNELSEAPIDLEQLFEDAVDQVLEHEDPQRFMDWLLANFSHYCVPGALPGMDEDGPLHPLAVMLGYSLWNSLPLPGNDFKPRPLSKPKPNAPCLCGSGGKFKQCCGRHWQEMPIDPAMSWPFVLQRIGIEAAVDAHGRGRIPAIALLAGAEYYLMALEKPAKAVQLLEPLFDPLPKKPDSVHAEALDRLFNLYDELHRPRKKTRLLEKLTALRKASPLRAAAYRRQSMIEMDRDDPETAWKYFQKAQRDDPEAVDLGLLEVNLLLAENRIQQAADRAGFWVRQLTRRGLPDDDPRVEFLRRIGADPMTTMSEIYSDTTGTDTRRLMDWLRKVGERPVPDYTVGDPGQIVDTGDGAQQQLHAMLRNMGLPEEQIPAAAEQLEQQMNTLPMDDTDSAAPESETPPQVLIPPAAIVELNHRWSTVFPLGKPFSVQDQPFDMDDPWSCAQHWFDFLEHHPDAFDSIEILDDLATALLLNEDAYTPWQIETQLLPLLERVRAIVDHALSGQANQQLAWVITENRPALRSLARLIRCLQEQDRTDEADALSERILELNPNDNHGFRHLLINRYLERGDDRSALALADRHPEDGSPEYLFGRALALYRQGELAAAEVALAEAIEELSIIAEMLWRKRVKEPALDDWIEPGGEEEGWEYREAMRPVWEATPGALDWLHKRYKQLQG